MSTQPTPMPRRSPAANAARKELVKDTMFGVGALAIASGVFMIRPSYGIITAGAFIILLPMLETISSFVRGLRRRT